MASSRKRFYLESIARIAIHPEIWVVIPRFIPRRRGGSLRKYIDFRLQTMYGDSDPDSKDVVPYMKWCKEFNKAAQRNRKVVSRRLEER